MKKADDFIPWKVTDISLRPYKAMWSMNPSIHFDGVLWRCVLRCSDYAMPGGVAIRGSRARPGETRTKNALVILDPTGWRPVEIYKMRERDELPRSACESVGYEDIRIFQTDTGGLQGIGASLHLRRDDSTTSGGSRKPLAEQVLISFSAEYNIVAARPIRGDAWGETPQKNWVPFDHCAEPRFLYSISRGLMFDDRGALRADDEGLVRPAASPRSCAPAKQVPEHARERARERAEGSARGQPWGRPREGRGERAPVPRVEVQNLELANLRGGTQLSRVGEDAWLGIGHAMQFVNKRKYYWHTWYLVDSRGTLKATSPPMKLASNGIEFAAGLAIDGDRVAVSFGVDDMECRIGETSLSAVMEMLRPVV